MAARLHLDERARRHSCSSSGCRPRTTRRSACRRRSCGRAATDLLVPARERPRRRRSCSSWRSSSRCSPSTASEFDGAEATEALLDADAVGRLPARRDAAARGAGVPVLLPGAWLRSPSRLRVEPDRDEPPRPDDPLERAPVDARRSLPVRLAARRRRRRRSARKSSPSSRRRRTRSSASRAAGTPLRRSEVETRAALPRAAPQRLGDRRARPRGLGPRHGRGRARAGRGDARRAAQRAARRRRPALPPAADAGRDAVRSCSGSRSAATAGCGCSAISGSARSSPTTWASARRCRRSRCSRQSGRSSGADALGPTLVVCPMSVVKQWAHEIERFAPSLRVLSHHGSRAAYDDALRRGRPGRRRRRHVVRHRDARHRDARARRVGPAAARRGAGREEPGDEAGACAAPAQRAAAGRDDGHADREPARASSGRSWTSSTRGCSARASRSTARSRGRSRRTATSRRWSGCAASCGRSSCGARRTTPEVELELPPITIGKDYCKLTVEQASLYQATVDRWMPRIEEQRRQLRAARLRARDARAS